MHDDKTVNNVNVNKSKENPKAPGSAGNSAMAGLDKLIRTKKFKVGLALFAIYSVIYTVFTVMGTAYKQTFASRLFGLNVGIVFGMFLIFLAIAMAIWFNWYAQKTDSTEEE
ncbi:MAG: DUF485 domain-containing protein [Candidatus Thermoplasmatota archaeon]|nr:DUF485 domain-containing protein [Candidatus Thermoplasmatota archaeon]